MSVVDNVRNNPMKIDYNDTKILLMNDKASQKPIVVAKDADTIKGKGKKVTVLLKPIPILPSSFPQ